MSSVGRFLSRLVRLVLVICAFVAVVLIASLLAARFAVRMLNPQASQTAGASIPELRDEDAEEIDFYEASGISREQLASFLQEKFVEDNVRDYPIYATLQNELGDYLADNRVIVRWDSGQHKLLVGASGTIRFLLRKDDLDGLRIIAPRGFHILKQRTLPFGTAFEPEETIDDSGLPYNLVWDGSVSSVLGRKLREFEQSGRVVPFAELRRQLRRSSCQIELSGETAAPMTPVEIYQTRRRSVVILGHAYPNAGTTLATGVVVSKTGVIATAYHVLDKPTAISRAVMTSEGRCYPILEVLAASRSDDVALIRIDASELPAAPLATADPEGTKVTLISHPGGAFFSLTHGVISRYWASTHYGRVSVKMAVTAEFADGSSGGPLFNPCGEVTGLVSATKPVGTQMVSRIVSPASAIRKLLAVPTASRDIVPSERRQR